VPFVSSLNNLLFSRTPLLDYFLTDMARRYSDLEEKYSQGQTELARVSASLNDANTLNSTLHAQLDSEKVTSELSFT
jgi:DNA repair exonuclease SbcCD ATPase subunit